MTRYGLPETSVARIQAVFARDAQISQAILYGSRAKGNYRPGSDIDLTVVGEGLTYADLLRLELALDDLLLPYKIDLSLYAMLDHPGLLAHIARVGVPFYERAPARLDAAQTDGPMNAMMAKLNEALVI